MTPNIDMTYRGELLVAILNKQLDFAILRERNWYRIPVSGAQKWLKDRWPPQWIAFYQTKTFGEEAHGIFYYGQVVDIKFVRRWQIFPDEPLNEKSNRAYYQVFIGSLLRLPKPIYSRRLRRIVFIPTTWNKFIQASEINDLFDESSLEDKLWEELRRVHIPAERQELVEINKQRYFLDFAIYCTNGKIDVETDGDFWHANPEKAEQDNLRENDLKVAGWELLRFGTRHVQEEVGTYVINKIADQIQRYGGVDEGRVIPRKIDPRNTSGDFQLSLFDDL